MMQRILALGLNPAYQKTLVFRSLRPGGVNRAESCRASASGKGVNFIRAAHRWGRADAVVLQPLGGVVGELLSDALEKEGLPALSIPVKGCTRTCTTLLCSTTKRATEIIEPSAPLSEQESGKLFDKMRRMLPDFQGLALCGTFPPGIGPEFYRDAVRLARERNMPVLLDAYRDIGECLSEGISFFKINQEELSHLMECQTPKPEEMDRFRKSHGIEVLAVTDGANPAILCTETGIYRIRIPRLEMCCNPIGAGDTCDAVLFSEVLENRELPEAFALGLAAASASCMTREPAVFARDEADHLYEQTEIERMDSYAGRDHCH